MQEFKLKDVPQRKIFCMACRGSWRQLPEMLAKLSEHITQADVKTIGPPGAFYYNTLQEVNVEDLEWEVSYPIGPDTHESINERTGFGVKFVGGVRVAKTVHEGSYRMPQDTRTDGWRSILRGKVLDWDTSTYIK